MIIKSGKLKFKNLDLNLKFNGKVKKFNYSYENVLKIPKKS